MFVAIGQIAVLPLPSVRSVGGSQRSKMNGWLPSWPLTPLSLAPIIAFEGKWVSVHRRNGGWLQPKIKLKKVESKRGTNNHAATKLISIKFAEWPKIKQHRQYREYAQQFNVNAQRQLSADVIAEGQEWTWVTKKLELDLFVNSLLPQLFSTWIFSIFFLCHRSWFISSW